MNHLTDDQLLLLSYGELPHEIRAEAEAHLASCAACRARLTELELSRAGLEWGLDKTPMRRARPLVWAGLAVAAGIAAVFLLRPTDPSVGPQSWQTHLVGSSTAGYVAGGAALIRIDSQLTRLEQGKTYGTLPN